MFSLVYVCPQGMGMPGPMSLLGLSGYAWSHLPSGTGWVWLVPCPFQGVGMPDTPPVHPGRYSPCVRYNPPWRCTPKKLQTSKRTFPVLTPSGGHCSGQCAGMVSSYYHLQHICRKYMFSQASVILLIGGGVYNSMHWGQHPPWEDTPCADTPLQTPNWADTPFP